MRYPRTTRFFRPAVVSGLLLGWAATLQAQTLTLTFVDQENARPLEGVVVMAEGDGEPSPDQHLEMAQQDRAFVPKVLVVPVGSLVDFPNRDNTQHHVYSFSPAKPFDIALYADQPEAPVRFDVAGVVELGCNIHDGMQGFILVSDLGQSKQSGADGRVQLTVPDPEHLKDGAIELKVWHPGLPNNTVTQTLLLPDPLLSDQTVSLAIKAEPRSDGRFDRLQKRYRDL